MQFVQRPTIDCTKWDNLVLQTSKSTIYSQSFFLDSVSENWCLYVNDEYTKGIVVPFTYKLNNKLVYTPNFIRYLEFLGDFSEVEIEVFITALKKEFKSGQLAINYVFNHKTEKSLFQAIDIDSAGKYNKLANRMLKRFDNSSLCFSENPDFNSILTLVQSELSVRIKNLTKQDFKKFHVLLNKLKSNNQLFYYGIVDSSNNLVAGAFFSQFHGRITYIKGASLKEFMNDGTMYALLDKGIHHAKQNNYLFDFGGSNIPGISQFFSNLSGENREYAIIKWGKEPLYYTFIKSLYHILKKITK